jgi:hypothetical protein
MAINTIQGYAPSTTEPIDSRIIKANASARLAIPAFNAYKGLLVYQQDTSELYVCNNPADPSLEASWAKIFTSTGTSGSYTGSFQGDGSGLTNVPASGIVGLNLSQTATGSVTASVDVGTTSFQVISGSSTLMSATSNGKIAVSKSINVGTPTSDPWQSGLNGSYFNNFTSGSDVADILRFIAGLLSASAPDAAPNTRTWGSTNIDFSIGGTTAKSTYMSGVLGGSTTYTNARLSQAWNQSNAINLALTGSYRRLQTYLIGKGWLASSETGSQALHDVGTHPFGISTYGTNIPSTIYNTFGTFTFDADSNAAGSTTFSSSISPTTFGLGTLINKTTVTPYSASIVLTQSFSNTASITTPSVTSTYTTSSNTIYTLGIESLAGTNGLFLGIINTGNTLIPNAYQDGKFVNISAGYTGRKWDNSDSDRITGASTSSIGYYGFHGIQVGLKTGSQSTFSYQSPGSTSTGFYMPSLGTLGVSNITQNDPTATITGTTNISSFTATSRSFSGAPYLLTTTYTVEYNTQVSKSFDPCYGYSTTPLSVSKTDGWDTVGSTTLSNTSVSVTTSGIQTSATTAGVFPAGTSPASRRSTNDIPSIGDVAFASSSYTFNSLDSSFNNTVPSRSIQESTNYNLSFTTTGRNWKDTSATSTTSNISFYDATRFGQPSASGSMAIYSFAQGYDSNSLIDTTETFAGETYRLQLTNNTLSGSYQNGDKFTTGSYVINNLGSKDLQVKPGYLVKPGNTYGYWITDPDPAQTYKYYARAFRVNSNFGSLFIDIGKTLTSWTQSTSNSYSVVVIFNSALGGLPSQFPGAGSTNPVLFDLVNTAGNLAQDVAPGSHMNPFTTNINVFGNPNQVGSGTKLGIALDGGLKQILNPGGGFVDFVVLIRYSGDLSPVTTLSATSS